MVKNRDYIFISVAMYLLFVLTEAHEFWGAQLHDRFSFWTAAKAFLSDLNPYDLEKARSYVENCCMGVFPGTIERVWGLPIILTLVSWFGLSSFSDFQTLHILIVSAILVLIYFGIRTDRANIEKAKLPLILEALVVLTFFPTYVGLIVGPEVFYVILGLGLYFYDFKKQKAITACFKGGLALSLCMIKPHTVSLIMFLIFVLSIVRKDFRTFFGVISGFLVLLIGAFLINPKIGIYYIQIVSEFPVNLYLTPTFANFLQIYSQLPGAVRFLPSILAMLALSLWAYSKRNDLRESSYDKDFMLFQCSIIASLIFAPYLWTYDFVTLWPLIIYLSASQSINKTLALILILAHVCLWIFAIPMHYSVWYPYLVAFVYWQQQKINNGSFISA